MNKYAFRDSMLLMPAPLKTRNDLHQITHEHWWEDNDYGVTLVRECSMPDAVGTRTINHN